MSSDKVHHISVKGYGGAKGEFYDKTRQAYHPTLLSFIYNALSKKENLNVAEMGAGTGLLTRPLLADPQWGKAIAELRVSEPVDGMREVIQQSIQDPRVTVSNNTFENSGLPDGWADVILIATAFHWSSSLEAASEEFKRVLKPDGVVIMVWQFEDRSTAWVDQMWELGMNYQRITGKTTLHFRDWPFRRFFQLPSYQEAFQPPEETEVKYPTEGNVDIVVARFKTWSAVAAQPDDEKEKALIAVREIAERGDGLVWVNKDEGVFVVPMACPAIVVRRK